MSKKVSAQDYPDHLNPFDENYGGFVVPGASTGSGREKYNTWSSSRPNQVSTLARQKQKPTFLEKPWAALNISPKNKVVRRLSILKTAVEKFTSKKKRLSHSSSESGLPPRSHSVHDDFNFKIISPKLKEKIRQQAFNIPVNRVEPPVNGAEEPRSPPPNGRLTLPLRSEVMSSPEAQNTSPTSPESAKDLSFPGPRPKTRKKRPPPPPPAESPKLPSLELPNGQDRVEDNISINSSITHDLEKDASSEEDFSVSELDGHKAKAKP